MVVTDLQNEEDVACLLVWMRKFLTLFDKKLQRMETHIKECDMNSYKQAQALLTSLQLSLQNLQEYHLGEIPDNPKR
mgnify:CR=1 FL=1